MLHTCRLALCRPLRDDEVLPVLQHRVVPTLTKEEEEEQAKEVRENQTSPGEV